MPVPTNCPISEVDRALSSYINSRKDTLRIRRTLSRYLTTSLRPVTAAVKNHHVNHESPYNICAASTNPPGLKGLRLEYLQALRAHGQAQTRHQELQASLEELQQWHADEEPTQAQLDHDNGSTHSYIALLRQRRRLAELQVIQDSLDKLLTARLPHAPQDPKTLVKEAIGDPPDLPADRLEQTSQSNDDQSWVFRLKQEVLESRTTMDRTKATRAEAQNTIRGQQPSLQREIHALECARNEMVEWVQGELSKMEEDSVFLEDASPMKRPLNTDKPVDLGAAEQRIRDVYDQYTAARASLVASYESIKQPPVAETECREEAENGTATHVLNSQMAITKVLSHLPHLARTANNDRSLLQQSVYLQGQMSSADQDIEEALLRLAGESHLLPAGGSKEVAAWGKMATEAEASTREYVKEQLLASREEVGGVSRVVEMCTLQGEVLAAVK